MVAHRWLSEIYEPILAISPADRRDPLEAAELYHEILEHRWYLSEQAGREADLFDSARDYFTRVLTGRPEERITANPT